LAGSGSPGSGVLFFPRLRHIWSTAALACLLFAVTASRASAQTEEADPADSARFRLGALRFTPSITLTNLGVDTNVFNDANNPQRDTTAAIGPAVNLWLKAGRSRLSGKVSGQYLYFNNYDSQRSWGTSDEGKWEVPLGRVTPFLTGSFVDTRQRSGYEIDAYARQRNTSVGLGSDLLFGGKTTVSVSGKHDTVKFDETESFDGVVLAPALNRASDTEQLQVRYKLTPLTTFVVAAQGVQDRFEFEPVRDADSIRVLPGFEFKPFALISGSVAVGYRWFNPQERVLPTYQGIIAAVDAKYSISATQIAVKFNRDLTYSYQTTEPYYALTDLGLTATERLTTTCDLVGRAGWQSLAYQQFALTADSTAPDHVDRGRQYGAGFGYRVAHTVRFGFDAIYYARTSQVDSTRNYNGLRYGFSISYGLQP